MDNQNSTINSESPSLRPAAAARYLGVGLSTFWNLAKKSDFPPLRKISARSTIVDRHALAAWRDQQTLVYSKNEAK